MLDGNIITKLVKLLRLAIFNPWTALWYIWTIILFLIIYKIFLNITKDKMNINKLLIVSFILYLFALLCNNYYFLIENTFLKHIIDFYLKIFITSRNVLFINIFMLLGVKIAKDRDKLLNIKTNKLSLITIISFILLIIEVLFLKNKSFADDRSMYLSFIIFIPSLFILFTKFKSNKNTITIRNLSTGIYFMHCICLTLLRFIIFNNYILYITTIIICTIILLILYKFNNKYLNYLIK